MSYPKLYVGSTPTTPLARRVLRQRALDLSARFRQTSASEPTYILLNFAASDHVTRDTVDLLLLRANVALVGAIKECSSPIDVVPSGQWIVRQTGQQLHGPYGETPLEQIKRQRNLVLQQLERYGHELPGIIPEAEQFNRTIGALICTPITHPETRVTLDIDDHRRQIKVLGWDELPALVAMVKTGLRIEEQAMRVIMSEVFGARLWHDGDHLLFELAFAPLQLRIFQNVDPHERILPLLEGANIIGRREAPLQHEYRLSLPGDDLMSNDHARIICARDGRVILNDTSTNGTWVTDEEGTERWVHHAEYEIAPDSIIRMGITRMRLERTG